MRPALSRMISLAVMAWPFGTAGVAVNFRTALTGPLARVAVWAPDFAVALSLPSYDAAKAGATSWPEATVPVTVRTIAVARGARRRLRVRRLCLGAVVVVSMVFFFCWAALPRDAVTGAVQDAGVLPRNFREKPRRMPNMGYVNFEDSRYKRERRRAGPHGTGPSAISGVRADANQSWSVASRDAMTTSFPGGSRPNQLRPASDPWLARRRRWWGRGGQGQGGQSVVALTPLIVRDVADLRTSRTCSALVQT